jgi:hypothetical protein
MYNCGNEKSVAEEVSVMVAGIVIISLLITQSVFVAVKVTNTVAWAWLWVLSPAWISVGALLAVIIFSTIAFAGLIGNERPCRQRMYRRQR